MSIYVLIIVLLVLIILMKAFQNRIVGYLGEANTAGIIKSVTKGYVLHDIYVNGSHGVQQIDLIAVTEKGVLVIEKKTYIGLILGSAYDKQWTILTGRRKQKFQMMNPHHQNFGHIQALCEALPQLKDKCVDVVIFGNNAKLGNKVPASTVRDATFKDYYETLPHNLSQAEMDDIATAIKDLDANRAENKKLHKEKIRGMRK